MDNKTVSSQSVHNKINTT